MKKILPFFIILLLIVGLGSFYGGMKYAESKKTEGRGFLNLTPEQMQERQRVAGGLGRQNNGQTGNGFIDGEILSKDDKSITIKLRDGGSKIIFITDTTQVMTMASTSPTGLQTGMGIMVSGSTNTDGSLTAKSIQIRPSLPVGQPVSQP